MTLSAQFYVNLNAYGTVPNPLAAEGIAQRRHEARMARSKTTAEAIDHALACLDALAEADEASEKARAAR